MATQAEIDAAAKAIWDKTAGANATAAGSWDKLSDTGKFHFQMLAEAALAAAEDVKPVKT